MGKTTNLLWTSGWDSTFRLLSLVLVQKKEVQPYYIISRSRQSCEMEIQTMDKIRNLIFDKNPEAKSLLKPTIYKERSEIQPNEFISMQYKALLSKHPLGDQYEYLARFAEETGINDLELSIHKDDKARTFIEHYVNGEDEKENFTLKQECFHTDLALFKYFRFPILNLAKTDMEQQAIRHNFIDIMNQTWFCHTPKNNQPCGICTPCATTIEEGLRRRLPLNSQIRNFIQFTIKPPIRQLLKPVKKQPENQMEKIA